MRHRERVLPARVFWGVWLMMVILHSTAGTGGEFVLEAGRLPVLSPTAPETAATQANAAWETGYTEIELELWRQALLLTAQFDFGLTVDDRLPASLQPSRLFSGAAVTPDPAAAGSALPPARAGGYALRAGFERSVAVLHLRLLAPDGHELLARAVPTGEGCSPMALQVAEQYSRTEMGNWLKLAGFQPQKPVDPRAPQRSDAIPESVLRAVGAFQPAGTLAAIETLERGMAVFPHPQTEFLLTRLHAEAYLLCAHQPGPGAKRFLARAFLYAQRAKMRYPDNGSAHYALAYAYALSGCGEWAARELDWARMERTGEESSWAAALESYLRCDIEALTGNRFGVIPTPHVAAGTAPEGNAGAPLADWPLRLQLAALLAEFSADASTSASLAGALLEARADADRIRFRCGEQLWWRGETGSPAEAPAAEIPESWRRERDDLQAAQRLYAVARGLPQPSVGVSLPAAASPTTAPQLLPLSEAQTASLYVNASLYPLLLALDADGRFTPRLDAFRDDLLYDLLRRLEQEPFSPAAARWLEQARRHWPDHPGIALWEAVHDQLRIPPGGERRLQQFAAYPAIVAAVRRAYALAGEAPAPDTPPLYPWSTPAQSLPAERPDGVRLFAGGNVQPAVWEEAYQTYAITRFADTPDFYQRRDEALDLLCKRWAGRMNKPQAQAFVHLIRDGAGLGRYRAAFAGLLRAAPEDSSRNAWALRLRAELESYEPAAYVLCWKLLTRAPAAAGEKTGNEDSGALLLRRREALLKECGCTPVVLLTAQLLQRRGETAQAAELAQSEIEFYRLYARAFNDKPKGLVRGLHALAGSPLTAAAALDCFHRLLAYLRAHPDAEANRTYSVAEVALSAGRAALLCGDREQAAQLLARAFTAQESSGDQFFYHEGTATRDPALAGRWLLEDLLAGAELSAAMRNSLEQAGAPALHPQIWK